VRLAVRSSVYSCDFHNSVLIEKLVIQSN
jgi:hypothetical protein